MEWKNGNIWVYHKLGNPIVIPTNVGWKTDGSNVMGRGLAKEASTMFTNLPFEYGWACQEEQQCKYFEEYNLILIPSKPLNKEKPYLSWKGAADYDTIKESLIWLNQFALDNIVKFGSKKIYVPIIGSGNGQLPKSEIINLMNSILKTPNLVGVEW